MRTRVVAVPTMPRDEDVDVVVDTLEAEQTLVETREITLIGVVGPQVTQDLDTILRHPAECRFLIRAGFDAGAPTDIIADSIADGHTWVIGPEWAARNYVVSVSLSDAAVPVERRFMAWRPNPPPKADNPASPKADT